MSREPLYPHVPGKKEPKFPHVTKGQQLQRLPQTIKPTRYDVEIGTWAERDRLGIWLTDKRTGKSIAEWWDENAREMFDQGFFKPGDIRQQTITGRAFEESVLDYAESVGLLAGSGKYSPQTLELLASTEGDPLRKFCCRICGECAPKELLEEGRFPDRISWLRSHYKEKHPGMWGKMSPMTISEEKLPYALPCPICFSGKQKPRFSEEGLRYHLSEFHKRVDVDELVKLAKELASGGPLSRLTLTKDAGELVSPEYRHLANLVSEPLPKDAY